MYFDFVYGIRFDTRKKQPRIGANPASRWLAPRIGFANPHSPKSLASQSLARLRPPLRVSPPSTCSPLIGNVRANPVAAPAAPIIDLPLDLMS
jgi:hypothetical protein